MCKSACGIFDGFDSTVDWPAAYHYKELMEVYPEARVLLSVRDAEGWARSIFDTIWQRSGTRGVQGRDHRQRAGRRERLLGVQGHGFPHDHGGHAGERCLEGVLVAQLRAGPRLL